MLGSLQICHRRKHLPLSGRGGELPAAASHPTATGTHTSEGDKEAWGRGGGRVQCGGGDRTGVQVPVSLQKGGREVIRGVWERSGTQKPSWDVRKHSQWLQRLLLPAGPAGLPATQPDRACPGKTPSIGPPPKTAPAALYSLCPRSCSPLHHSCRPDAPQN